MAMVTGGSNAPLWGAWDFGNPKNWVINKPLEQNWREFSTGIQVIGLSFPSATLGKFPGATIPAGAAAAASGAGSAAAAAGGAGAAAAAGSNLVKPILDLTEKGLDLAIFTQIAAWLTKYWWIPTIFIGLWTVGKFGGK